MLNGIFWDYSSKNLSRVHATTVTGMPSVIQYMRIVSSMWRNHHHPVINQVRGRSAKPPSPATENNNRNNARRHGGRHMLALQPNDVADIELVGHRRSPRLAGNGGCALIVSRPTPSYIQLSHASAESHRQN